MTLTKPALKRIILIASLSLIGALVIAIITMAVIVVDLAPRYSGNKRLIDLTGASSIEIYNGTSLVEAGDENHGERQEQVRALREAFDKSFKASFLSAATSGHTGGKYNFNRQSMSLSGLKDDNKFILCYWFDMPKQMYEHNGNLYEHGTTPQKYYAVFIVMDKNAKGADEATIYFRTDVGHAETASTNIKIYNNYKNLASLLNEFCGN